MSSSSVIEPVARWTGKATPPTQHGYRLTVACSCGVVFERWVLPEDAVDDLLRSALLVVDN